MVWLASKYFIDTLTLLDAEKQNMVQNTSELCIGLEGSLYFAWADQRQHQCFISHKSTV